MSSYSRPTPRLYITSYLACNALSAWQGCVWRRAFSCRHVNLDATLFMVICVAMARPASLAVALAAASLAIGAASPLAAQSARDQVRVVTAPDGKTVYVVPAQPGAARTKRPQVRTVVTPDGRNVYVVDEQPKDTRTQRQRCVDDEVAREGGSPSALAMSAIDLKCSQR